MLSVRAIPVMRSVPSARALYLLQRRTINTGPVPTFHYQRSMPRLAIPPLEKTCDRYKRCVSVLLTEEEKKRTFEAVDAFCSGEGAELDAELRARDKANAHTSYIDAYWSDYYLRDRSALPINVNPFLQLRPREGEPQEQVAQAAALVAASVRFQDALRAERLEPDIFHVGTRAQTAWFKQLVRFVPSVLSYYAAYFAGSYPLDMSQYPRLFGTSRVPRAEKDELVTNAGAAHVAVMCRGHMFTVPVRHADGRAASGDEVAAALADIRAHANALGDCETPIGALSTLPRDRWAQAYAHLEAHSGDALRALQGALFVVCLDDSSPHVSDKIEQRALSEAYPVFLHGDGRNRWFDKSVQLIVCRNGASAVNFEHSWGDGVSVLRYANEIWEEAPAAAPRGEAPQQALPVTQLEWHIDERVRGDVEEALRLYGEQCARLNVKVLIVDGFGKKFFKAKGVSPDGVVQNAIQLAYRRAFGRTVATYESASTAGFKKGRTEVIRPATRESVACVDAFVGGASSDERRELLRKAAEVHSKNAVAAAMGQGFDRHLFALRKLAEEKGMPVPAVFADAAYARINHNVLSTSTLVSPAIANGGFGPVVDDGFGVGYATSDELIGFAVSSYLPEAEAAKFVENIEVALGEFRDAL